MIPIFSAKVSDEGELVQPRGLDYKHYLDTLKGKQITIAIEPYKSRRSLDQNALYWVWLGIIADCTGDTKNDLHEYFRRTFLEPKFIDVMGKKVKIPRSTTELGVSEFSEYLMRIEAEAGELGIQLPTRDKPIPSPEMAQNPIDLTP